MEARQRLTESLSIIGKKENQNSMTLMHEADKCFELTNNDRKQCLKALLATVQEEERKNAQVITDCVITGAAIAMTATIATELCKIATPTPTVKQIYLKERDSNYTSASVAIGNIINAAQIPTYTALSVFILDQLGLFVLSHKLKTELKKQDENRQLHKNFLKRS